MDGVDAAFEFAGIVGVNPRGLTLRQLWRMAIGAMKQKRLDALHIVCLAFNSSLDTRKFLEFGIVEESQIGKPFVLRPDLEAKAQEEIEKIRRENPNLPKPHSIS